MAKKKNIKVQDDTLQMVVDDFKSSWDYCVGSWHQRWEDNYKLYNNQRVKRQYIGVTDTFVPMVYSTIETMTAAIFGTKPKFQYIPPSQRQDQKTDILNGWLDNCWERDQWSLKMINTGRSTYNLGTAVDFMMWDVDHPVLINISLRDYFIDPTSSSRKNAKYEGRRYLDTIDNLKTYQIVDPETGEMVERFKGLDTLKSGGEPAEKTDKQEKDFLYGSTLSKPENKQVECIEYWTNDKLITVVNRELVAENRENPHLTRAKYLKIENPRGIRPFVDSRDIIDPSLFYAKSTTDFIADQQELLNDQTNQCTDYVGFITNQMYTLDPEHADQIKQVENVMGAVYPFKAGTLVPVPQRNLPPEAFNERMNIKNEIRETTASNEIIKGVGSSSNATATEVNAQMAGAGNRINLKVTQLENGYFHDLAKLAFDLTRLYVTEPMMIRMMGKDGAKWELFDPSDFRDGDYTPRVQLDITVQNNKARQSANAKEMLGAFMNDPDVNQIELKKIVMQRSFELDPDEVELLMAKQPELGMQSGTGELPPEVVGAVTEAYNTPVPGVQNGY